MKKVALFYSLLILVSISSCKSYEKLNGKKYIVKEERVSNGNLFTLILYMKVLYNPDNNKQFLSYIESAKKMGYEKKSDPYYVSSKIDIDEVNKTIIVKNYHINGYDTISKKDSICTYFKIINKDSIKLEKVMTYFQGDAKIDEFP